MMLSKLMIHKSIERVEQKREKNFFQHMERQLRIKILESYSHRGESLSFLIMLSKLMIHKSIECVEQKRENNFFQRNERQLRIKIL